MKDHPFFKDTPKKALDMAGQPMEFPIFYYDVRFVTATFTAKASALKKSLPLNTTTPPSGLIMRLRLRFP
jgi:hypothetical protein